MCTEYQTEKRYRLVAFYRPMMTAAGTIALPVTQARQINGNYTSKKAQRTLLHNRYTVAGVQI